ncbi:MAG: acyl-CoA thioesterase [Pseudomonadales bacterium]|nr:acyl-CoA thioesterase [Pseudomonadales bacterium]
MGEVRNKLYELSFPSRWGDMDALGHVNNTVYFRYFENVRTEWLTEQGFPITLDNGAQGPVIVDACCQFLIPAVYPVKLKVLMFGGVAGRSSFNSYYELRAAEQPDTLFCTGTSRIVWVDYIKGESIPLPESIRALLPV